MKESPGNSEAHRSLELKATAEEVMRSVEILQQFAQERGVEEKIIFGLALALEECGSNVVNHALQRDARQLFQLELSYSGQDFSIELRDRGPEFDPTVSMERPLQAQDDDLPGGWGIHLTRRFIDKIHYERRGGENILRLTKRLSGSGLPPSAAAKIEQ